MLALQLCGVAISYLPVIPSPLYLELTRAAYECPAQISQAQQIQALDTFHGQHQLPSGVWRVLPPEQLNEARRGDGVLLPNDPGTLLWKPGLARQYKDLHQRGVTLILNLPHLRALPAMATSFAGLGIMPDAAMLAEAPSDHLSLGRGTYLLRDVGGLPLLPQVAQVGQAQVIPYLPDATSGQRAAPELDASAGDTAFQPRTGLSWTFAGQHFDSAQQPQGQARWLATVMPVAWVIGEVLNVHLPSLIYTASDSVAWLVLALLLVTFFALLSIFFRRRSDASEPLNARGRL